VMERRLTLPIDEAQARELRLGDILYLTGRIFTARDEAHLTMLEAKEKGKPLPFDPSAMALFHCGPVVRKAGDGWEVIAAGPTTSVRMEIFEDRFLETFAPRIVIGKGGMGDRTQAALEKFGCVYAHYTGGAGALAAERIERVEDVHWLDELGMPEAAWIFAVKDFGPLLVTMDSAGGNLYKELEPKIAENLEAIRARIDG
jgi:fumarate hydratase subunit beta